MEEARLAIAYGASAVGLVSEMPSGPGPIPEDRIAAIAAMIPPGVASFLLTSKRSAAEIVRQALFVRTNTIQIVDEFPPDEYSILRQELPATRIVQVIHVRDESAIRQAVSLGKSVDAILLDSGNPGLATKELGGTGRVHDWAISRRIREQVEVPVYLAGGLNPENVRSAIQAVQPFAVDVCSGVRTNGSLDEEKLSAFVTAVRGEQTGV